MMNTNTVSEAGATALPRSKAFLSGLSALLRNKRRNAAAWARGLSARSAGRKEYLNLANVAEGTHQGNITKLTDAAITQKYLLGKVGSASDRVAVCGAADDPIGVITDEAAGADELVNVALLGSASETVLMTAGAAIAQGALVEPAANGKVLTAGSGSTVFVAGRALSAAANAGDLIEVDPFYLIRPS